MTGIERMPAADTPPMGITGFMQYLFGPTPFLLLGFYCKIPMRSSATAFIICRIAGEISAPKEIDLG